MTAVSLLFFFFFNDTAPTDISPLPLHAALRISQRIAHARDAARLGGERVVRARRPRGRADPERLDYDRAVAGRVQQGNEGAEAELRAEQAGDQDHGLAHARGFDLQRLRRGERNLEATGASAVAE